MTTMVHCMSDLFNMETRGDLYMFVSYATIDKYSIMFCGAFVHRLPKYVLGC